MTATITTLLILVIDAHADTRTSSARFTCGDARQAVTFYREKTAGWRHRLNVSGVPPLERNPSCARTLDRAVYWRNNAKTHRRVWQREWADPPYPYYQIAVCETGGINGGRPLWSHHNGSYAGAYGFAHSTWTAYRYPGYPLTASAATPRQQTRVAMRLVATFGGYSSWPACHRRLGLPS